MSKRMLERARKRERIAKGVAAPGEAAVQRTRADLIMSEARNAGLVGGPKDAVIRGRVSTALVKAAKTRAGVRSDTELVELALSNLALADDFGDKFLKRKGAVDPDLDLEL